MRVSASPRITTSPALSSACCATRTVTPSARAASAAIAKAPVRTHHDQRRCRRSLIFNLSAEDTANVRGDGSDAWALSETSPMVLACLVKEPGTKTVFLAGCAQSFAIRATDDHVLCASDQPAAFVGKSARSRG